MNGQQLTSSLIAGALIALATDRLAGAPPEFLDVTPAASREAWLQRMRSPTHNAGTDAVGQYEKFELLIDLRATFENPYDADEIDLWAEFTAPSGKVWKIWGFYNPSSWSAQWMVRFAPTEIGEWTYVLKVRDREGVAESEPGEFTTTRGRHHGFLRIADNQRYFQYTDGSSFYGVGLWYNDGYDRFGHGAITEQGLDELKQVGCNFISFYPTPLETTGTGLGRYDQNLAGRLDEIFAWCEERDLHISWNLIFHSYVSEAVWGGGNARYRNSPYRGIAAAKDWFASEEVWKRQEQLYRYTIARWGYSRALFLWFVVDEINGTEGWEEGGSESAEAWCRRMNEYFHQHDPYGRATTGTQSGGIDQWWPEGYRIFDVAARETYETQGHPLPSGGKPDLIHDSPIRASYLNYARQTSALWKGFAKPAAIGECGWDHTYYEPGMPGYLAMYHNALWASLANGACATPFWWAYSPYVNDSVVTAQLRWFAVFVRDIPFADSDWSPLEVTASAGDAWAMKGEDMIYGWAANPASSVAKERYTLSGIADGEYDVRLYRTWRGLYLPTIVAVARGGQLSFEAPELTAEDGRGQFIGDDVAFKITPRSDRTRGNERSSARAESQ
jgi:hypothetical protein